MDKYYFDVLPHDLLLNMLLTYFSAEELCKIFIRLIRFKKFRYILLSSDPLKFWKSLYQRDISSFIPYKNKYMSNPENILAFEDYANIINNCKYIKPLEKCDKIIYLARNGYDILLKPLLESVDQYIVAMEFSLGHLSLLKDLLFIFSQKHRCNIAYRHAIYIMQWAAIVGNIDVVKLMIENGANNFNEVSWYAASHGHKEIVELMLKYGANSYKIAIRDAR